MDIANPLPFVCHKSDSILQGVKTGQGEIVRGGSGGQIEGKKDTKEETESCGEWSDRDRELCKCTTL